MDPKMMTRPASKQGNKMSFYQKSQSREYSTNNSKPSPTNMIYNNSGYPNLTVHKPQYPQQYQPNLKNTATKFKNNKPTTYQKNKNVGAKVFCKDYEYPEPQYTIKQSAKLEEHSKVSPDRTKNLSGCSTMPSEEELTNSVLHGFKVIHDGRTLHDETQADESIEGTPNNKKPLNKFASSIYNLAPNPKDITLPSFMDD
jgi:hypothetical protein